MSLPTPLTSPTLLNLKLTRAVEADPRHSAIEARIKQDCRHLWEKSTLLIPHIPLSPSLETCLKTVLNRNQLAQGLENIDRVLRNEQKGLQALQKSQGTSPSLRVSRLFLVSNDGSERFYRACEKTLLLNQDRVLLLRIEVPSSRLAQCLMGESEKTLKALLVSDRDAVSSVLLSLVENGK